MEVGDEANADGNGVIEIGGDVYQVVRRNNRFRTPLFNGYRDILYSLRLRVPQEENDDATARGRWRRACDFAVDVSNDNGAGRAKAKAVDLANDEGGDGGGKASEVTDVPVESWHVCEVQLHLAPIFAHKNATHA